MGKPGAISRMRAVIAPTAPTAQRIVGLVQAASRTRKITFVDVENADAIVARLPEDVALRDELEQIGRAHV